MFYKKIDGDWWCSDWVSKKNYTLDKNNKQSTDGWEWHDEPPQEYLDWVEEQENIEDNELTEFINTNNTEENENM